MKIVFVGDEPSKDNLSPDVAFVGTKSYKTLLGWFYKLDISVNDIVLVNKKDVLQRNSWGYVLIRSLKGTVYSLKDYKIIALGREAQDYLVSMGFDPFYMPHPSPRNRALNDASAVDNYIASCYSYIRGEE